MKTLATLCFALFTCLTTFAGGTLTTVAEGNGVPLEDITSPRPFDFTGTVLIVGKSLFSFSDESGGTYIFAEASTLRQIQQWDVVHVKGEMLIADEDKTRRFVSHEVSVIRRRRSTRGNSTSSSCAYAACFRRVWPTRPRQVISGPH